MFFDTNLPFAERIHVYIKGCCKFHVLLPLCARREHLCVCVCVCEDDILFFFLVVNGVDEYDKMCGVLCVCCIFVFLCSTAVSKRNYATEFVVARQK